VNVNAPHPQLLLQLFVYFYVFLPSVTLVNIMAPCPLLPLQNIVLPIVFLLSGIVVHGMATHLHSAL
jgi:hypothetical protein